MVLNHLPRLGMAFTRITVSNTCLNPTKLLLPASTFICSQNPRPYAARAGKREKMKAEKKKRKQQQMEEKETPFVPYRIRLAQQRVVTGPRRYNVDKYWLRSSPVDDVWCKLHYPRPFYDTTEAIEMHRETHHPTMINVRDDLLKLRVELNLELTKKNKYLSNFTNTVKYPHCFDRGSINRVIALCNTDSDAVKAIEAGAIMAGGKQLIEQFQDGQITPNDYDHVVAHPDILKELLPLRGILKKHFPNQQKGTLGMDLGIMVDHFVNGFTFNSESDDFELDYGWVEAPVGRLDMTNEQLEENIAALLKLIDTHTPKGREGQFVTQVLLSTTLSKERFVLKHWKHLEGYSEIKRLPISEWLKRKMEEDKSEAGSEQVSAKT